MKTLVSIAAGLALAAMVLLAIAVYNLNVLHGLVSEVNPTPVSTTKSTLTVVPNYGEQTTVSGAYLQPANVCVQNCK